MTLSPVSSTWIPPGPRALGAMGAHEAADLADDVVEVAGLATVRGAERVAVHRVARPHHGVPGVAHGAQQRPQSFLDVVGADPADQRQAPRRPVRVEAGAEIEDLGRLDGGADLAADRVADAAQELDVGAVDLACALADPQQVGRAVVPVTGQRVLAGQRLLVAEDQGLVAGVHVDRAEVGIGRGIDAAGLHELEGAIDLRGQPVIALAGWARGDELLVPGVHPREVGEPALGEGADEVQRRGRLVVRLDEPVGVRHPSGDVEAGAVDDVAAERGEIDITDALCRAGPGLGELAGDPTDLHDRDPHRVRQHDGHLEDDAQLLPDVVGRELLERLGAVAGLEQERTAGGDLGQ